MVQGKGRRGAGKINLFLYRETRASKEWENVAALKKDSLRRRPEKKFNALGGITGEKGLKKNH